MEDASARRTRSRAACLLLVIAGVIVRIPQLSHPLAGDHAFRQTQTAFGIREYAAHGINLLQSPLPVFGGATDVPMEFPLFQAIGRVIMLLGIDDALAGRLAALISFQAAAVLWWNVQRRWRGATWATMTLVLVEFLPFGLHWGAACLIDFFSVACGLCMVLGFDVWLRDRTRLRWFALAGCAVGAWLLFLVKVTTVPAMGILLLLSAALAARELGTRAVWRRTLAGLIAGPLPGLVALLLWTRHADIIKDHAAATRFLTSANLREWNMGGSRLWTYAWGLIDGRVSEEISGPALVALVLGVALGALFSGARTRLLVLGLCVAALAPVLIFFNLFAVHSYYLIAIYPILASLCALGPTILWERSRQRTGVRVVSAALIALLLAGTAATPLGRSDVQDLATGTSPPRLALDLRKVTPPDAKIVTVGCDWDPQTFYFAHRAGLMVRALDRRSVRAIWRQNDVRRYTYLARCDDHASIADFLPRGARWIPTSVNEVYRLYPPPGP